jgi:hypothetical protein
MSDTELTPMDNILDTHDDSTEPEAAPEVPEIKLGPTDDGGYITPYQMTIVYHQDSVFETAVAVLGARAQLVPLAPLVDYNSVAGACEHISPEVLIFGTEFSREAITTFFERGFHFVHVFSRDPDYARSKYYDGETPFDPRMVVFGVDTLYEHVRIIEGLLPIYVLEFVICASFPSYKTQLDGSDEINHLNGKYLITGLEGGDFGAKLLQLCSTYKGFEIAKVLQIKGATIHETREKLASTRISQGITYQLEVSEESKVSVAAIYGGDLTNEMINLLPVHPHIVKNKVSMAVLYSPESHTIDDTTQGGFRFTFINVGSESVNALETLRVFAPETVTGAHGIATAWCPFPDARRVLSFM